MIIKGDEVNEFLANPEFVRWVKNPDRELERYWVKWMEANPDSVGNVKLAREMIHGINFHPQLPEAGMKEAVLANILTGSKTPAELSDSGQASQVSTLWIRIGQSYNVAAILIITFGMSFLFNFFHKTPVQPVPVAEINTIIKSTDKGEKLNFKLPDGSLVFMNSGSEISFPEKFDSAARVVQLKGEAFFEVNKSHPGPFQVISDDLTTTALGTSFNINNHKPSLLSISLVTGKVKVENGITRENILLVPGQQLQYAEGTNKTVVGSFNEKEVTGWMSGVLQFSLASFEEVRQELERWYGVNIQVSGKPARKWHLTGEYQNQNLEVVLHRISYIEEFKFSIQDKNVQIKF